MRLLARECHVVSDLAGVLAALRKNAGLSRRQLEEVAGVSEETIKALEYGRNTRPSHETLRRLATALATNRALKRVDQRAADEVLTALLRAAKYLPRSIERAPDPPAVSPDPEPIDADILEQLRKALEADPDAMKWILNNVANAPADERAALIRFYRDMAAVTHQLVSNGG